MVVCVDLGSSTTPRERSIGDEFFLENKFTAVSLGSIALSGLLFN
jgi:hypothetical protein